MKIKTSELQGAALNWAVAMEVAKAKGYTDFVLDPKKFLKMHEMGGPLNYDYSTWWAQGGPIIEREKIGFRFSGGFGFCAWKSYGVGPHQNEYSQYGPTPLIAAMRCYVASKLGDEVEVPDELHTV
jgi:hypothetical protein